jgi:hypothetical protein
MAMRTAVRVAVIVFTVAAVGAALGLKRSPHLRETRSEAFEHGLDHMVGSDAKNRVADFCRQMPVPEMPGKTRQLPGVCMPDLYNRLRGRLYFEPSPVLQLQPVTIGHGNGLQQIEEDLFALIRDQADTPTVTLFEIESDGSPGFMLRPASAGSMNGRAD